MLNLQRIASKYFILICCLFFIANQANAQFTISDDFKSSSVVDVIIGDNAKLTSGDEDPVNAGWLRLTTDGNDRKGYAYVNKSFPSTLGVVIDFEYTMWRSRADNTYHGADGISLFLFDANYGPGNFQLGAYGGSLGYANRNTETGVTGGYVGIGLDAYGNFANRSEGKNGGANGLSPNSIALRGPTTSNNTTTNRYLKGVTVLQNESIVDAMTRAGNAQHNVVDYNTVTPTRPTREQFYRRVQIEIIPTGTGFYDISVRWTKEFGGEFIDLMTHRTSDVPPALLKVGFAASTGGGYNNHEVRNLLITTPGNLRVVKRANKDILRSQYAATGPSNEIEYKIEVVNDTPAELDEIDFSDFLSDANGNPIPNGIFEISSITHTNFLSQTTLPNPSVANPITSGEFTGTLHLAANSTGTITVKGKLTAIPEGNRLINTSSAFPTTIIDQDLLNNTSKTETPVVSEKSDLVITSQLDQSCLNTVEGNRFNITSSNIGNLNLAYGGRTENNRLTVTTTFPAGVTPVSNSWSHTGWSRTNSGSTYTFTRTNGGTLISGSSLPTISYTLRSTSGGYTNTVSVASTAEPIENQNNNSASSTVDATPNAPAINNSPIYYCLGALASTLEATALPGHSLRWYLNPGGAASSTPFTPSTLTSGSTIFYVTQIGPGGCESDFGEIEVVVLTPTTSGSISGDQTICHSTLPGIINSSSLGTGEGTINYRWEKSEDEGATWTSISGEDTSTYQPPILQKPTWYRRATISSGIIVCESETTNIVVINVIRCKLITNPNIYNRVN